MSVNSKVQRRRWMLIRHAGEQNWRCCYCGCRMLAPGEGDDHYDPTRATTEHILPAALGGVLRRDNVVVCCLRCNRLRGRRIYPMHLLALGAASGEQEAFDAALEIARLLEPATRGRRLPLADIHAIASILKTDPRSLPL